MRDFEWDFLKVIKKEVSFFGHRQVEKIPIIRISGGTNLRQRGAKIRYRRVVFNLTWPVTLQLHMDLTDYLEGSALERHADLLPSKPGEEYRLVVILNKAAQGGELLCDKFVLDLKRVKIFSTRVPHEVTKVQEGTRRALLFGVYFSRISPIGR